MTDSNETPPIKWLGAIAEHEGFPLALRVRPHADSAENLAAFGRLLMITLALAHVRPNGLPESEYNQSLFDLDRDIIGFFESMGEGLVAMVETFAGKRRYYGYVEIDATFKERFGTLQAKYSQHELIASNRIERTWATYKMYRSRFPW